MRYPLKINTDQHKPGGCQLMLSKHEQSYALLSSPCYFREIADNQPPFLVKISAEAD